MNIDDTEKNTDSNAPPTDSSGTTVNVVERDLRDSEGVDQTVTPSSSDTEEQDEEEQQRKIDEIERKVADGN